MDNSSARMRDVVALAFASLFPLAMSLIYMVAVSQPEGEPNPALQWVFGCLKAIQFLFPALYVGWFEREQIRFAGPTLRGMAIGAGFGLVVGVLIFVLFFGAVQQIPGVAETMPRKIYQQLQQFHSDTPTAYLRLALFFACVHSLLEEYYWRWFVFGWARRYLGLYTAITFSSVGFMLHHIVLLGVFFPGHFWTLALPFSLCVAVGGGVWAWLYQHCESLYAPWLSHFLIDAAALGLGYVIVGPYMRV
jgi:uncharacterized protein